jgi:Flp pilus assembly protein TadB
MDDKELIKKIMEEVKDEKLREELLALVAEKNRRQSEAKQEEEHGMLSKTGLVIMVVVGLFLTFFAYLVFGFLHASVVSILASLAILAVRIKLLENRIIKLLDRLDRIIKLLEETLKK